MYSSTFTKKSQLLYEISHEVDLTCIKPIAYFGETGYYVGSMNIKQTVKVTIASLGFAGALAVAPTPFTSPAAHAEQLRCAVLPQSICSSAKEGELERSGLWNILLLVLNIMTFGVGVVAVAMVAYASFLYTTAQDNGNQTKEAIEKIRNVVIGIVCYALMWAFLNFLIPGGVFA